LKTTATMLALANWCCHCQKRHWQQVFALPRETPTERATVKIVRAIAKKN